MGAFGSYHGNIQKPFGNNAVNTQANPFGKKGGSLGRWDVVGNSLDSINPLTGGKGGVANLQDAANPNGGGPGGSGEPPAPNRPDFGSLLAGGQGSKTLLGGDLKVGNPADINATKSEFNNAGQGAAGSQLQKRAMDNGPSAWLNLQTQKEGADKQNALNNFNSQNAGNDAGARAALMAKGGLSGGSAERMATNSARNANAGQQGIQNQSSQNLLGLGIADQNTKTDLLKQAATQGQQLNEFNASGNAANSANNAANSIGVQQFNKSNDIASKEYDINNALGETAAGRQNNMDVYKQQMQQRAGDIIGNQIAATGGKGKK